MNFMLRLIHFLSIPLILIVLLFFGCGGGGSTSSRVDGVLNLAWDSNSEPDLAGYKIYYGTASGTYGSSIDVGMPASSGGAITYSLTGFTPGQTYYVVVRAYDTSGNESTSSNEVSGVAR